MYLVKRVLEPKAKGTDQKRTAFVTRYTSSAVIAIKIIFKHTMDMKLISATSRMLRSFTPLYYIRQ